MAEREITVVIPTRDRWSTLATAALRAALAQRDVDHEVIVVDDGSADDTSARLAALDEPRLRVIRHELSHGVAQARNAGIAAAAGEWVAFLDDDDLWAPEKLRRQIDLARGADAAWAYAASAALDGERRFLFSLEPADPEGLARSLLRWNVLWGGCSNVVARTDVVRRLSGFDERLFQLADWDLWIRLALSERAVATREILLGCVMHSASMLATDRRDVFREMEYLAEKHRVASLAHRVDFDQRLFTRWVAFGHRRAGRRGRAALTYVRGARRHGDLAALPRAAAALLGEPAFRAGRALVPSRTAAPTLDAASPPWLAAYQ
jgi:glycosyltransferase involved in cell wall biosynthesis